MLVSGLLCMENMDKKRCNIGRNMSGDTKVRKLLEDKETHCYLLNGNKRTLLIDTGLGISNIYEEVLKLTDKPITAAATHIHWDHIGGHKYFPDFYVHADELKWLNGKFPLSIETIGEMVVDRCDLPEGFCVNDYEKLLSVTIQSGCGN